MRMIVLFFIKIKILINKAMISLFSSHENASFILYKNQNTNKQGDYFLVQLI